MPEHTVKIIVNTHADLGRAWRTANSLKPIVEELGGADWAGTVYPTHATELARQAAEAGYSLVIACGGDGTTHEVVNGLMQAPEGKRPRLGVVPLGSGNDFSHAIGMDPSPQAAIRQALTGSPQRVDLGRLYGEDGRCVYWVNAVGLGFDTTVTLRSKRFTLFSGFPIFLLAVVQTILLNHHAPKISVKSDQGNWDDELLLLVLCNGGREGGGFFVSPEARTDDGVLNYTGIRKCSRLRMFRLLPEVMQGKHARFPQVRTGKFRAMELQADGPLYIHTDGEIYSGFDSNVRRLRLEILPQALEIVR